jgi:hypothetical protein
MARWSASVVASRSRAPTTPRATPIDAADRSSSCAGTHGTQVLALSSFKRLASSRKKLERDAEASMSRLTRLGPCAIARRGWAVTARRQRSACRSGRCHDTSQTDSMFAPRPADLRRIAHSASGSRSKCERRATIVVTFVCAEDRSAYMVTPGLESPQLVMHGTLTERTRSRRTVSRPTVTRRADEFQYS